MNDPTPPRMTDHAPELLPNLTRQFDLLRKGCKSMGLGSWEDQFGSMQDDARAGKIKADDIVEIIDSDYRNERGGRAALAQFVEALLADALTRPTPVERPAEPTEEQLREWVQWLDWDTGLNTDDEIKQLRNLLVRIGWTAPASDRPVPQVREAAGRFYDVDFPARADAIDVGKLVCGQVADAIRALEPARVTPSTAFVQEILQADAAPPEASFDNAEDMLKWLVTPSTVGGEALLRVKKAIDAAFSERGMWIDYRLRDAVAEKICSAQSPTIASEKEPVQASTEQVRSQTDHLATEKAVAGPMPTPSPDLSEENGEAFKNMAADIWAAGANLEEADFITRMLARKGLYLFQTEPWNRCHSPCGTLCRSPRNCAASPTGPLIANQENLLRCEPEPSSPALPEKAVAWLYEMAHYIKPSDENPLRDWKQVVTTTPPPTIPKDGVRNVQPLYARPDNSLVKALEPTKAEERVRELLVNNGRNAANNRAGIPVGSTLHLCELLLCQIENARTALAHRSGT